MRNAGSLIANKIGFLNRRLARVRADVDLADANARCGDRRRYFFFKGRVWKALRNVERVLRDNRTPLPQEEADRLTADFLMCTLRYRALKVGHIPCGTKALSQYCQPPRTATIKVSS